MVPTTTTSPQLPIDDEPPTDRRKHNEISDSAFATEDRHRLKTTMMRSKYAVALTAILSFSTCHAFIVKPSHTTSATALFANLHGIDSNNDPNADSETKFTTAVANGYTPPKGVHFAGIRRTNSAASSSTQLGMSDSSALLPDGGLSPCVIKVVGVGGGGCNAVSLDLSRASSRLASMVR